MRLVVRLTRALTAGDKIAPMTRLSPPDKQQMIEHLEHELVQFCGALAEFSALDRVGVLDRNRDDPERIRRTAFFECFLLHARILDEFLGMKPRRDDFAAGAFTDAGRDNHRLMGLTH